MNLEQLSTQVQTNTTKISQKISNIQIREYVVNIDNFNNCINMLSEEGDDRNQTAFQFTVIIPTNDPHYKYYTITSFNPVINSVDGCNVIKLWHEISTTQPDRINIYGIFNGHPDNMGTLTRMTGKLHFRNLEFSK